MQSLFGNPVAPGVALGQAFLLEQPRERLARRTVAPEAREGESQRLESALEQALEALQEDRDRVERDLGPEAAKIFDVHLVLLRDKALIDPARKLISEEGLTAPSAVSETFADLAQRFRSMGSQVFRDKARDVLDLEQRVLRILLGRPQERLAEHGEGVVVIAHELTPADAAALSGDRVLAVVTEVGGRTDHTSIVASALGVPVVVGCSDVVAQAEDGDLVIVDGTKGRVIIRPTDEVTEQYAARRQRLERFRASTVDSSGGQAITTDGTAISLQGNIEFVREIPGLLSAGGEGVGLYRTEFLYLTSETEPDEETLTQRYADALRSLDGRPLTLRTLDLGADKYTQAMALVPERNPFLGLRSIRWCLQHQPTFRRQLRAALRASMQGNLRIMFPLVTTVGEFRQARLLLNDVRDELIDEGHEVAPDIPVGMMVEVPSAAIQAASFAKVADFFSIGTNDLIQYTVAVDRGNERVANLYTAANPAILRLVRSVVRAAGRRRIPVSLCGEIAGDVTYTMLLIGLGLRSLSLVPALIPRVREVVRRVSVEDCEKVARRVTGLESERGILRALREELERVLPEIGDDERVGPSGA
ncbi:MAG: phosphoenolpyruvate--protein phosphotransferase [Phycisphaerales bacterium]|nr:phosphoenolpyruvate--protein phosphotransferase [Phycisphaerales bacterium]